MRMISTGKTFRILWFGPLPAALLADTRADQVEYQRTRSSDQQFEQLVDGSVDAVVTAIDNVVEWNRRAPGADFRVFAQLEKSTDLALFGRPGLAGLEALRGARLLVDAPANGFAVALLALLDTVGIAARDCTLVPAGGVTERLDALLAGQGDATLLGPPFDQAAREAGCRQLAGINAQWPQFPGQGLVLSRSKARDLRPELIAWLDAMTKSRDWMKSAPEEATASLIEAGLPRGFAARAPHLAPASWRPDPAGIALLIEHRRTVEFGGGDLDYADLVDLSLIDQA
jgi:ABC-type nitrate/sulfonate/bicarbonate transport system substrate-binding protein